MIRDEKVILGKLEYYKKQNVSVHITCNFFKFYNGLISEINADSIILIDEKLGATILYISEISDVEKRMVKE